VEADAPAPSRPEKVRAAADKDTSTKKVKIQAAPIASSFVSEASKRVRDHLTSLQENNRKRKRTSTIAEVLMMGSKTPMAKTKGEKLSLMQPTPFALMIHPFGAELKRWQKGVVVECGPAWSREAIDAAVARGPHPSAMLPGAIQLVHEEVEYQVQAGFSEVMLWEDIKNDLPECFKVSPAAVIPQANRRGRLLLDLSFKVRRPPQKNQPRRKMGDVLAESVNDLTTQESPSAPVKEIGRVLRRLFQFIAETPESDEILLAKVDLSDGFWRIIVDPKQRWNFCYIMPDPKGAPIRVVVPSALQMGWQESPGYFCTATETGRDIVEWLVAEKIQLPAHPFEHFMLPLPNADDEGRTHEGDGTMPPNTDANEGASRAEAGHQTTAGDEERVFVKVFVDDYILALAENTQRTLLRRVARATLFGIHSIFPPPSMTGHSGGKDPISEKKLEKGDARFLIHKEILGFLMNGRARTVQLPQKKADHIINEIRRILRKKSVPLKQYMSVIGKIRHAAQIVPVAKGLMSPLNAALQGQPKHVGLGKKSLVRAALLDLITIISSLAERPTHVSELVVYPPVAEGCVDASSLGAGGVWFGENFEPTVWRVEFPKDIVALYKVGTLTNSDLEMAGVLIQNLILEQLQAMERTHSVTHSDNTPATSWATKLAARAASPVAGFLIRALAMRQRTTKSAMPVVLYWPGVVNILADTASRSYTTFHYGPCRGEDSSTDQAFLTLFASTFPLPQNKSWHLVQLEPVMLSHVISTLRGKRLQMRQWTASPAFGIGRIGSSTAAPTDSMTTSCSNNLQPPASTYSWLSLPESVQALLEDKTKSRAKSSPLPYDTSPTPSFWPDIQIPDAHPVPLTSTLR
jgi:hypothetical protein